ncbi:efflux RND transporter periplasmic adaptor subunit, partial [uncultured Muribaculum sp.]
MALFTKPLTAGRNLILLLALFSLTFESCKKNETTLPVVAVEPSQEDDVEIYGEYVGRVRAQQFVEVRARVEGYLERMLFEEGTYVDKNQVLFIINQDQYKAKVDKARAQLKKDESQEQKAKRDLDRIRPLYEQN